MSRSTAAFCNIYAQFDQVGDRLPEDCAHLAALGLPADITVSLKQASRHRDVLARIAEAGGIVSLNWYPHDADPACTDPNWWRYDHATCLRLVRIAQERFADMRIGPLRAINTYTPGNALVSACREVGIGHITGLCAPIVIEDGGWDIAHYGAPLSPYFASDEDFRKPEDPGDRPDAVLMSSMELRNPLVCAWHWSEGPWCPLNAQAADRWLEPSGTPWPFLRAAEDWIRQGELDGEQRFFHINLQYFFAGACRDHNRRALEWLAMQRDRGRLEIGGLGTWARRMRLGGGSPRQTTWWRGEMAGFHVGNRPGFHPDTIVDEDVRRQAVFLEGHPAPRRLYDYRRTWSCHPFRPEGGDPASADVSGLALSSDCLEQIDGRRIRLVIENDGPARTAPLVCWDALADARGPFVCASGTARLIPHPSGCGAAVLVEACWPSGRSEIELIVGHGGMAESRHRRRWGGLVEAQTFVIDRRPCTVIALQAPAGVILGLRAASTGAVGAAVEGLVGIDRQQDLLRLQAIPVRLDGTRLASWVRIWDRWTDEIELDGVPEAESRLRQAARDLPCPGGTGGLAIPEPGYQVHGDLTDPCRWDLPAGEAAGDVELAAVESRLREVARPRGRMVAAIHPGLAMPCGSITKVLGHRFDRVMTEDGFSIRELCADYPQAWAPGVAGWVQWRHLSLALAGPWDARRRYRLHLHACDPESRGISQRVHLYDPSAPRTAPQLCVEPGWDLPAGLAARMDAAAFRSLDLPAGCLGWPRIGVWISPLEPQKLHDWIASQGAPGVLMHAWLEEA